MTATSVLEKVFVKYSAAAPTVRPPGQPVKIPAPPKMQMPASPPMGQPAQPPAAPAMKQPPAATTPPQPAVQPAPVPALPQQPQQQQQPQAQPQQPQQPQPSAVPTTSGAPAQVGGATSATTQQPQPQLQPLSSADYEGYTQQLQSATTPEAKDQVIKTMTTRLKDSLAPEDTAGANDVLTGNMGSPAAKQFIATRLGPAGEAYQKSIVQTELASQPDKANDPNFFGQVTGKAAQMWDAIGPMGQLAMTFGVPAALIGLMGGGGLTALLGGLGIGAAGIGAAGMGVFGDQAQAATGKMLGDAGNFFGMIPDEARDASNFNETAADATKQRIAEAMRTAKPGEGARVGQEMLDAERAKFAPLQQLYQTSPQLAHSYLMGMKNGPQTADEAAQLYDRLNTQYEATGQKDFLYNQALEAGQQQLQDAQSKPGWEGWGARQFADENYVLKQLQQMGFEIPEPEKGASMNIEKLIEKWAGALSQLGDEPKPVKRKKAPYKLPEKFVQPAEGAKPVRASAMKKAEIVELCQKAARCWAGYEPVPGAKSYSKGSCRPKGSKKTQKEMKKS